MIRPIVAILTVGGLTWVTQATPSGVEFNLTAVEDSGAYYMYRYEVVNPDSSIGGVTSIAMDLSVSSGTPQLLATTGTFFNLTSPNQPPFAPVGVDVPTGWTGILNVEPEIIWELPTEWNASIDSVAPGDTVVGFVVRSPYLPGIRAMSYAPTVEACCLEPVDTTQEIWISAPMDYEVGGLAVGPRYAPTEVNADLLLGQMEAVCDDPPWIDDAPLCAQLGDSLAAADSLVGLEDYSGASATISSFRDIVLANGPPTGEIAANAFWLLSVNAQQLLANLAPEPVTFTRLANETNSGFMNPLYVVLRTEEEWSDFWDDMYSSFIPQPERPSVNFSTDVVIGVAMGAQSTGGYSIEVDSIGSLGSVFTVAATHTVPGPGCDPLQWFTQPVDVVRAPLASVPDAQFTVDTVAFACH